MRSFNRVKLFCLVVFQILILSSVKNVFASSDETVNTDFIIKNGVLTGYKGENMNITIPDSVTAIGDCAFMNSKIESITLPNSVTAIGYNSFSYCINLKKIIIPNSVTSIGREAFWCCTNLVDIKIPSSIKSIGGNALNFTSWLDNKRKENPFVIINGILIDGNACKGSLEIPDEVTSIADSAFTDNDGVTSVIMPNTVTYIGMEAFFECRYLVTIRMSDTVTYLGQSAFMNCTRLKNIRLSKSLKQINPSTFEGCSSLEKITIPQSVTKICELAFRYCKNLKYATISDKVTKATNKGLSAFVGCHKDFTIYGYSNSYIEKYAKLNKINFRKLEIDTPKATLTVGKSFYLKMNSLALCEWKSSDKSIAIVSSTGKVTAKKKGKATITITLYGKSYKCYLIVN